MNTARSFYTSLIAGVVFPLHERLKKHATVAIRRELERTQWLSAADLKDLQLRRLQSLLRNAQTQVPYYREQWRNLGFDAQQFRSLNDLSRLPFLGKAEIRANIDALKSERAVGLARFNTGGSSGEPLIFHIGRERVGHDVAAKWRATRWWGVDIGDPEIVVWGSPIELGAQDRIRLLRDRLLRTALLPAFEMSEAKLDDFIRRIRARRPRMLFGYPSSLSLIARHAERRGQRMDDLGLRVAFVTSERLYEDQRHLIERVFACPVANGYGGRDAGFIAHQCPQGGMHITAEDIVVEIVDSNGDAVAAGDSGEIVVTHLATKDFPFIRYRTGDIASLDPSPCSCGRGLPMLKEIQGRSTDFVLAADGTVMHGLALIYVLRDLTGIAAFKITQESLQLTRVQIVPGPGFTSDMPGRIEAGFKARLGAQVQVIVDKVGEIPAEKSGKFRYVSSKVAPTSAAAENAI